MEVPNFRWWQCGGCTPDAAGVSIGTGKEGEKPTHKADVLMQNGQASKLDPPTGRNSEASTSTDSNDNRNLVPTICADPKGKGKAHAEDELPPLTGFFPSCSSVIYCSCYITLRPFVSPQVPMLDAPTL